MSITSAHSQSGQRDADEIAAYNRPPASNLKPGGHCLPSERTDGGLAMK